MSSFDEWVVVSVSSGKQIGHDDSASQGHRYDRDSSATLYHPEIDSVLLAMHFF